MKNATKHKINIKKLLVLRCMSQTELAKKIGMSDSDVSRYVRRLQIPRPRIILRISTTLNATPSKRDGFYVWTPNEIGGAK